MALSGVEISDVALSAWIAVLYLALAVTIVGYFLWYWPMGKGGIERIGKYRFP